MFSILDPISDTFDSIARRSRFCFLCVLLIAARIQQHSSLNRVEAEVQNLAAKTLFSKSASLEQVQAMAILTAYTESGWFLLGHTVRLATDLGLHKSLSHVLNPDRLPSLQRSGSNSDAMLAQQSVTPKQHIRQARVWLVLAHLEREITSGMGKRSVIDLDKVYMERGLLRVAFSQPNDLRILSNLELTLLCGRCCTCVRQLLAYVV